jgi:hypothetical protein
MRISAMMTAVRAHSAVGRSRPAAGWRGVLAAGAAVAMAAWGAWVPVSAAASASVRLPAASLTETFGYVGPVAQTVTVPAGASLAEVRVIGGKGGGTRTAEYSVTGGDGAQVSGRIAVTPGQVLRLQVAGYGGDAPFEGDHPGGGGWGATGYGGRGGASDLGKGGGGGGASGLEIGGETVVLAGGGGGAGGRGFAARFDRGGPGGSSGATVDPGHNGTGPGAGKGGVGGVKLSGPGGNGDNGSYLAGDGGGGGAGYRGGGGGGGGGFGGGGGGGGGAGSSHYTSLLQAPAVIRGGTSDGNGLIFITWNEVSAPVCFDQVVQVPFDSPRVPVRLHCSDTSRPTGFRIVLTPGHGRLENLNLDAGTFSYVPAFTGPAESATYTVTFTVGRLHAPMYLSASSTDVVLGHPPVLVVTMPTDATGHVGFYDIREGEHRGIGTAPIIDGGAILIAPTTELGVGTHLIRASYGGDARYAPSESNVVIITVRAP